MSFNFLLCDMKIKIPTHRMTGNFKAMGNKVFNPVLGYKQCSLGGIIKEVISVLFSWHSKEWIINTTILGILGCQNNGTEKLQFFGENPGHHNGEMPEEVIMIYIDRVHEMPWLCLCWDIILQCNTYDFCDSDTPRTGSQNLREHSHHLNGFLTGLLRFNLRVCNSICTGGVIEFTF